MTTSGKTEATRARSATSERRTTTLLASLKRRLSSIRTTIVWDTRSANDWQDQVHRRDRWS